MTNSPKTCRSGQRCEPENFREALHCQVHHSALAAESIADRLGMAAGSLNEMVNPYATKSTLPSRHLPALLALTQDNATLPEFIATVSGGIYYKAAVLEGASAHVAKSMSEIADYLRTVAEAEADGRWTRTEFFKLQREIREAMQALMQHEDAIERRLEEDEGKAISITERRRA